MGEESAMENRSCLSPSGSRSGSIRRERWHCSRGWIGVLIGFSGAAILSLGESGGLQVEPGTGLVLIAAVAPHSSAGHQCALPGPALTLMVGWLALGERPTPLSLLGGRIALAGWCC